MEELPIKRFAFPVGSASVSFHALFKYYSEHNIASFWSGPALSVSPGTPIPSTFKAILPIFIMVALGSSTLSFRTIVSLQSDRYHFYPMSYLYCNDCYSDRKTGPRERFCLYCLYRDKETSRMVITWTLYDGTITNVEDVNPTLCL